MHVHEPAHDKRLQQARLVSNIRLITGGALFIGGFLSPLLIPLVTRSDLPNQWKAALSTGLVAGLSEIGMVPAVAVLGKQGFAVLKNKLFALLHRHTKPAAITAGRYRAGLVLFCLPLLVGWLTPYLARLLPSVSIESGSLVPIILLDLVFAASLLVLGENFWEKLRWLFIYETNASGRQKTPATDGD